ncbi:hypothetical protein RWE15_04675 [Virgibacillus halophilus]|uniref:Multiple sugar transport system permease protein n=1 Tax=Tigheibacillus halophilus TaxID=361280 RepID=A0ABU5C4Y1_9BACI|nr:hypothetical protein [Virgibacillus halophilus]
MKHKDTDKLVKIFIYVAMIALAVSIIIPVAWVFLASIKENKEFYENPWAFPNGFHIQNFIDAFQEAKMGEYLLNSVIVTILALAILLVVALPAAYVLSRFKFKGSGLINGLVKAGLFINISYIAVPIFLMLLDWDTILKTFMMDGFFFE